MVGMPLNRGSDVTRSSLPRFIAAGNQTCYFGVFAVIFNQTLVRQKLRFAHRALCTRTFAWSRNAKDASSIESSPIQYPC